ncbi:hypothetical protein [Vulcanisaeta souniana]|uniref:hypothetical protein n=1 Tax=Vulcanisaeta souniana TaxID=164452 RepID=UPI001FB3E57E|nr:hypothetical protein [Vulcanisaeta souniana]
MAKACVGSNPTPPAPGGVELFMFRVVYVVMSRHLRKPYIRDRCGFAVSRRGGLLIN